MLTPGLIIFTSPSHSLHKKGYEGGGKGWELQPRAQHCRSRGCRGPPRVEAPSARTTLFCLCHSCCVPCVLSPHFTADDGGGKTHPRSPALQTSPSLPNADEISVLIDSNQCFSGQNTHPTHTGSPPASLPALHASACVWDPHPAGFTMWMQMLLKITQTERLMPPNASPAAGEEGKSMLPGFIQDK